MAIISKTFRKFAAKTSALMRNKNYKMMKKLAILFLATLLPMVVEAEETIKVKIGDLYYNLSGSVAEVTFQKEHFGFYKGNVVIPSVVTYKKKDYTVTSIGKAAFQWCNGLTSVTIPNSVTTIGNGVFRNCSNLASIVVESGNPKYDSRNNCNAIIETSSNTLVHGCKNTIIPNSVTSIGSYAFFDCSGLTSVTIPNSVTSIGSDAFLSCI